MTAKRTGQAFFLFLGEPKTRVAAQSFLQNLTPEAAFNSLLVEESVETSLFWYYLPAVYKELTVPSEQGIKKFSADEAGRALVYWLKHYKDMQSITNWVSESSWIWEDWRTDNQDLTAEVIQNLANRLREDMTMNSLGADEAMVVQQKGSGIQLLADPHKSILGMESNSKDRLKSRAFILGRFLDRQGKNIIINAVEKIGKVRFGGIENYTLDVNYQEENASVPNVSNRVEGGYRTELIYYLDNWTICEFYPFGLNQQLIDTYGGTGAADLIVEYLIKSIQSTSLDLRNSGITDFAAMRLYLRQRIRGMSWPSRISIDGSSIFPDEMDVADIKLRDTFFDDKNVGDIMFKANGSIKAEQQLRLTNIGPSLYKARSVAAISSRIIRDGDNVEVSFPDAVVKKEGQSVGRISALGHIVTVSGFSKFLPMQTDGAMRAEVNKGGIDFNPQRMELIETKENTRKLGTDTDSWPKTGPGAESVSVPINPAQITGVTFTIREIIPVTDLPQILGLKPESQETGTLAAKV